MHVYNDDMVTGRLWLTVAEVKWTCWNDCNSLKLAASGWGVWGVEGEQDIWRTNQLRYQCIFMKGSAKTSKWPPNKLTNTRWCTKLAQMPLDMKDQTSSDTSTIKACALWLKLIYAHACIHVYVYIIYMCTCAYVRSPCEVHYYNTMYIIWKIPEVN